jgi:hypothetical protein
MRRIRPGRCARAASGHAAAAAPSSVMNARRFTVDASVLPTERIAHLSYGRRLLRCGISIQPETAWGSFATDRAKPGDWSTSGVTPKADMPHSRRQLFANAAIAVSRVACSRASATGPRAVRRRASTAMASSLHSPDGREVKARLAPCDVSIFRHNGLAAGRHSNRFPSSLPDRSGL